MLTIYGLGLAVYFEFDADDLVLARALMLELRGSVLKTYHLH